MNAEDIQELKKWYHFEKAWKIQKDAPGMFKVTWLRMSTEAMDVSGDYQCSIHFQMTLVQRCCQELCFTFKLKGMERRIVGLLSLKAQG